MNVAVTEIPHMGASKLAPWFVEYASAVPHEQAIVEVGAWLGAGTQYLVRERGPLFVYDRFQANNSEVQKARKFGLTLVDGQDTLPWVKSHLPESVNFRKGNLQKATYNGPKIGLYADDASKSEKLWLHSMQTFEPHFIPGTILMLQDWHFPPCHVQREYSRKWQVLVEYIEGTSCAVFKV